MTDARSKPGKGRQNKPSAGRGGSEAHGSSGLRTRAEKIMAEKGFAGIPTADTDRLVHELHVHQIELEMQNEELKRVQQEIEESREKYMDLYDFAPVAYFSFDQNGLITNANLAAASLVGVERAHLIGNPFSLFVSPPHRDIFFAHRHNTQKTAQTERCELLIERKDSSLIAVLMESVTVSDETGHVTTRSTVTDITERKRMEEALSASENRYRNVFQGVSDGFIAVTTDGRFVDANPVLLAMLGYSLEELLTLTWRDITPEKWHAMNEAVVKQLLERGYSGVYEKEYVAKDGRIIPVEVRTQFRRDQDGNPEEVWVFVRDITARKQAEATLRESEEKYRSIFENAIEGIFQTTTQGEYLSANPALARMYGYDSPMELMESIENLRKQQYVNPRDRDRLNKLYEKHGSVRGFETLIRKKNGEPVWISMSARAVKDSDGQILFYEGTTIDISRRKRAEMLRDETEKTLKRQSEQLRTLSKKLAELHERERHSLATELHDRLGGNLTALGINLSMLKRQLPETLKPAARSRLDDALSLLEETVERMRDAMSNLRPAVLDDWGLPAALRWYADEFRSRTGIEVTLIGRDFGRRLDPSVETALFRIAQEALTNVAKHAQASRVEVKWGMRKEKVSLAISDNGVGFPHSNVGGDDTTEGWGLLIMKERAVATGGRCTIGPGPKGGTRVWVEIPV